MKESHTGNSIVKFSLLKDDTGNLAGNKSHREIRSEVGPPVSEF